MGFKKEYSTAIFWLIALITAMRQKILAKDLYILKVVRNVEKCTSIGKLHNNQWRRYLNYYHLISIDRPGLFTFVTHTSAVSAVA